MTRTSAAVLVSCLALTACESGFTAGDVPNDFAVARRGAVRSDGTVRPIRLREAGPTSIDRVGDRARLVTGVCSGGAIVDGSPEGGLPSGDYDDVVVPAGEICVIANVTVTNSVTVEAGGMAFIQGSQIGGDVVAQDAEAVQLNGGTTVGGNVSITGGGGWVFSSCSVDDATIVGDLSCTRQNPGSPVIRAEQGETSIGGSVDLSRNFINPGHVLLLETVLIGGAAEVSRNSGGGYKHVAGNTVTGTLSCKQNDPTFAGGPNTAAKIKGQCF